MAVKMPKKNGKNGIKQVARFGLFWAIIIFVALIFYAVLFPAANLKEAALSDVVRRANEGKIAKDAGLLDRKSTRLNSSHHAISYAVFCLNKKRRAHL